MTADPAAAGPVAVAFCPAPPLLHPAVARGAAAETAKLLAACTEAVSAMLASAADVVVVVGTRTEAGLRYGPGDVGSLRGFGVDLDLPFAGRPRPGGRRLPLAHALGAWLLDEAGYAGTRLGVAPPDLLEVLAGLPGPVGVLAMGDGSARRTVKAPGYLDAAAAPFDAGVAAALAAGDAAALAALDPAEGRRLLADGVDTWRAVGAALRGRTVVARLRHDDAPFGVGYLVADWLAP
ncbi:hypothetical protein OF117_03390 [Geodermatophilus sp. YIM 151500]|uniref:hypothetical protein n=1 Tax=Geodermatophilus sp. YIM 151500 TaxID=2984531 RepID=UPI0021E40EE2|nr:hypothetical protein [Geodermatophilus sp. YIM 151500]MCV2488395.1 hypothetical protein [Geodermatophilus sp. YIM 151500]